MYNTHESRGSHRSWVSMDISGNAQMSTMVLQLTVTCSTSKSDVPIIHKPVTVSLNTHRQMHVELKHILLHNLQDLIPT